MYIKKYLPSFAIRGKDNDKTYFPLDDKGNKIFRKLLNILLHLQIHGQ